MPDDAVRACSQRAVGEGRDHKGIESMFKAKHARGEAAGILVFRHSQPCL